MASFTRATQQMVKSRQAGAAPGPSLLGLTEGYGEGTTQLIIPRPAEADEGTLMLAIMNARFATGRTWSDSEGFTEVFDQSNRPSIRVAWKVAGTNEPASYAFDYTSAFDLTGQILCFGNAAFDTMGTLVDDFSGNGDMVLPGVDCLGGLLVALLVNYQATNYDSSTPAGLTFLEEARPLAVNKPILRSYIGQVDAGPSGARTSTITNNGSVSAFGALLAIKSAA